MTRHRSHGCGGDVILKQSIIDDVHKLVNDIRKRQGKERYIFNSRSYKPIEEIMVSLGEEQMEDVYTLDEIDAALAKHGSIRVHIKAGTPKIKCSCNCGTSIPVGTAMQGWRYIRGHKSPGSLSKNGHLKNGSSGSKPVVSTEVYASYADRISMDLANIEHEMKEITKEATRLQDKLIDLKEKAAKLKQADFALKALYEKPIAQGATI